MKIVAILGSKGSGKTSTIEKLTGGLVKKGYKVATAKHISEKNFTIDSEGKDTWRHTQAGAKATLAVAPEELTIIKKGDTSQLGLHDITCTLDSDVDVVFLEGFKHIVEKSLHVDKIVAVRNAGEAETALKKISPIIAFTGFSSIENLETRVPYVKLTECEKLEQILVERLDEKDGETPVEIWVKGKKVGLNPFVTNFMRKTVLAMVSSLKNVRLKGEEKLVILVEGD